MAMVAMAATHGASAHRSSFLGAAPSSSRAAVTLSGNRRGNAIVRCHLPRQNKVGITPMEERPLYKGIPKLGPDIWNKTYYPKKADHLAINKPWYIVDASNKRLGRLASTIAHYLRGKDNPMFTPSLDMGSYVVVINAEKVGVTGNKRSQKLYRRHSGRPGGLKEETFDQLQKRIPERIVEHAVRGMLPKNRLGRAMFKKLKVFKGAEHPHAAQKPVPLPIHDKRIQLVLDE